MYGHNHKSAQCKSIKNRTIPQTQTGKNSIPRIQPKLNIGQPNNAFEGEADRIADQVINATAQKKSKTNEMQSATIQAKPLLNAPGNLIQRYAFVGGEQVDSTEVQPNETMQAWTADSEIRDYEDRTEFEQHAAGNKDYLGILRTGASPGTWVRFEKEGLNILGEDHTKVSLMDVAPAVGSTDFVYEVFTTDDLSNNMAMSHFYEEDNQARYEQMGIAEETDKRKHGLESTFPKIAYTLVNFNQYLSPSGIAQLQSGTALIFFDKYIGQPYQRYLKLGWAWSQDNRFRELENPSATASKMTELAALHNELASDIDPFFNSLQPDGFLGDALALPENTHLIAPLRQFADALKDTLLHMLANEPDSPLEAWDQLMLNPEAAFSTETTQKNSISELRDLNIVAAVNRASENGMRYAGMGLDHMKYIKKNDHMKDGWHAFDMANDQLKNFEKRTQKLKSIAE